MKYTLGPWTSVTNSDGTIWIIAAYGSGAIPIAQVNTNGPLAREQSLGNARQIAAVPELIAALIDIRDSTAYDVAAKARAAIALEKAGLAQD